LILEARGFVEWARFMTSRPRHARFWAFASRVSVSALLKAVPQRVLFWTTEQALVGQLSPLKEERPDLAGKELDRLQRFRLGFVLGRVQNQVSQARIAIVPDFLGDLLGAAG
jgi:hypothetical protein